MRVNYIRDGLIEEFHTFSFVQYSKLDSFCDETPYYLRSCAKPLQASLLIDCGADKVYNLTSKELALICGSHAGEDCHIETGLEILKKIELDESYLKCGVHEPLSRTMQDKMLIMGKSASAIHNNCSGKHIGFLALCKLKHWDLGTYDEPTHPLQIAVKNKINALCEVSVSHPITTDGCGGVNTSPLVGYPITTDGCGGVNTSPLVGYPITTDGCGVPILSMPLKNMLIGFMNLFTDSKYEKITNAFLENPYILGGEDRLDTEIIQNTNNIIAKVGAGGLCIVVNLEKNDGFVVKMDDASMPARRIAVFEMINRLNWGNIEYDNTIKTIAGKKVGNIVVED